MTQSRWPTWTREPRTQLLAGAIGAVLGLTVAGYGLFTAQGTTVSGVPREDAATVNAIPILRSDLIAQLETTLGKPAAQASLVERHQALDDMIREELLVRRGLELDEASTDPDTRAALVSAVDSQVAVDATSEVPTEAALRQFYMLHRAAYSSMGEMTVRDLVPARALTAVELSVAAARLRQEPTAPGAALGLKDSGKVDGEELYFAAQIHLGDRLFRTAAALSDRGVAGPIAEANGPHILVMLHNTTPKPRSFEDARQQVYSDYKQDLEARLRTSEYKFLRAKADIRIATDLK